MATVTRKTSQHRKRKYKRLSDEQVLALLLNGTIWVVGDRVFSRGREVYEEPCRNGYLFIRVHDSGARRKIAKHKLIWMASRGRTVPDGCDVHHKRGKARNFDDDLRLLDKSGHRDVHRGREPGEDDDEVPF